MMKSLNKIERFVGGLKFAVILIALFTVQMIIGTFLESYYGTEFANRIVYKSYFFMLTQFSMFLSIFFAMLLRLPPKNRLRGFYAIHTGLIMIGCGSFITYISGIDGSMPLSENNPSRSVYLNRDVLKVVFHDEGLKLTQRLPYTAFTADLDETYKDITFSQYYPFADKKLEWKSSSESLKRTNDLHSSKYLIFNDFTSQDLTLSVHPKATDFESNISLGPLNVQYLPESLGKCFARPNPSGFIFWHSENGECFTPEEREIPINETSKGNQFLVIKDGDKVLTFFPKFSPWPLDKKLEIAKDPKIRLFNKNIFTAAPTLFLFGKNLAFYDKNADSPQWVNKSFAKVDDIIELPWMGFKLQLLNHSQDKYPSYVPVPVLPIQKGSEMVRGSLQALKVTVQGKSYWVTNEKTLSLLIDGQRVSFLIDKDVLTLPFELSLTRFVMEKSPGTERPASYESFVQLFSKDGLANHHIYMNNPLKHEGFTFYQASYSKDPETGKYSSTLSVNVDQGRYIKYFGSLLLIFGAIAHYIINRKKTKKKLSSNNTPLNDGPELTC